MNQKYYTHSGKYSFMAIIFLFFISLFILPLIGMCYSFAITKLPLAYAKLLFVWLFYISAKSALEKYIIVGKIRNTKFYYFTSFIALLMAYYIHWAVFLSNFSPISNKNPDFLELLCNPILLFKSIGILNSSGIEMLKYGTWSGTLLYIIWFLEFIVMNVLTMFFAYEDAIAPFSEKENYWLEKKQLSKNIMTSKTCDALRTDLEKGDFGIFENEEIVDDELAVYYKLYLYESNNDIDYLTIRRVDFTIDKGETKEHESYCVHELIIPKELTVKIKQKYL